MRALGLWLLCLKLAAMPLTYDYRHGQQVATAYQKPLALLFTGSSWNKASRKLEEKVLSSDEFGKTLGNACVVVHLDYSEVSSPYMVQNYCVKNAFDIEVFPTVILLDPSMREIARTGFLPLTGREYALHIKTKLREYEALVRETGDDYEALYFRAKKLGCERLTSEFLAKGMEKGKNPTLLLEHYARCMDRGESCTAIRQEILESGDVDLEQRLAMLDYQRLGDVHILERYCASVGQRDPDLWRIQLLIAEHYTGEGKLEAALLFARRAAEKAPLASKVAILDRVTEWSKKDVLGSQTKSATES